MSWGIDFTAHIFLSRQCYCENVLFVQEEIDSLQKECQDIKERMLMLVAGGKSMVNMEDCEGDGFEPIDILHSRFNTLLDEYNEHQGLIQNLHYYKEYLENLDKEKEEK